MAGGVVYGAAGPAAVFGLAAAAGLAAGVVGWVVLATRAAPGARPAPGAPPPRPSPPAGSPTGSRAPTGAIPRRRIASGAWPRPITGANTSAIPLATTRGWGRAAGGAPTPP